MRSAAGPADYPADGLPELALVGRSNVGKSTLVNALVRQRLARTSGAPGKTRLLNLYRVSTDELAPFYLVDLPGYGYARGEPASRQAFEALTREYFESRAGSQRAAGRRDAASGATPRRSGGRAPAAFAVLLLVDGRHPGLENDRQAHDWVAALGVPFAVAATKIDKLSRAERSRVQHAFAQAFTSPVLPVSAVTGEGMKDLWRLIARLLNSSSPRPPDPKRKSSISPR